MTVEIRLTRGRIALIDDDDCPLVAESSWIAARYPRGDRDLWYAQAMRHRKTIRMHRVILGNPAGMVDHINGDGLDNRRVNLRVTDARGNALNRRATGTGQYRGVSWDSQTGKWRVRVTSRRGIDRSFGLFDDQVEAALVYNKVAPDLLGSMVRLNEVP